MFTKNIKLKLVSLFLAISLEFYFISPTNLITATLKVPIEIANVPVHLMMVSPDPGEDGLHADIKIRGPAPLIDQARSAPHRFVTRIPDDVGSERGFQLKLNGSQLGLPSGVSVVELIPENLEVKLEEITKRALKVSVQQEGEIPAGFEIEQLHVEPDAVMATGPESEMKGLREIETELIDVSDLRQSRVLDLPLVSKGPKTVVNPSLVRVELIIAPKKAERVFDGLEVKIQAGKGIAATVDPARAKVILKGENGPLAAASVRDLKLSVDLDSLTPGEHEIPVTVHNSTNLQIVKVVPEKVRVKIIGKGVR